MRTGRPKATLKSNADEERELTSLAHRSHSAAGLARRARIVLACAEGHDSQTLARKLRVTPATVGKWRNQIVQDHLGACTTSRAGCPLHAITDEQVEQVVVRTPESTPRGATHGSTTREMAKATGHRPAPSLVALYCSSSDSQHNPRLRIGAGHSIVTNGAPTQPNQHAFK